MKIPEQVRKTVAFIGYRDGRDGLIKPVGSMFFIGDDSQGDHTIARRVFAVTARHVIEGLKSKGCTACFLRLNPTDATQEVISIEVPIDRWVFHPTDSTVDVAMVEQGIPNHVDQLALPLSLAATSEAMAASEIDLGDEVFVSGLFIHHFGSSRNIPIVRVGHLAALNEEHIQTRRGLMDAYLIEARSIGGLSGSPVFLNLGTTRTIGGSMVVGGGPSFLLLGLIHGHFESGHDIQLMSDSLEDDASRQAVNAGIAIVVPFHKIKEVYDHACRPRFHSSPMNLLGAWGSGKVRF